jgi:L-fuculose-phosphate aldolase
MILGRRSAMVAAARFLAASGLVIGSTGNVSVRTKGGFLITPTRRRYDELRPWQIVDFHRRADLLRRHAEPSRESSLHRLIYEARPDVGAVVHHHGPFSTAASQAGDELLPGLEEREYFEIGSVRVAAPAAAGSRALAESCIAALGAGRAVLLAGHGLVAVGSNLTQALDISVAVEHEAQVSSLAARASAR